LLVLQRNHGLVVLTESGNSLQAAALGLGDVHDRTVAVDGMAIGGKVPLPTLSRMTGRSLHGRVGRWREPRDG
jgi:hypothetical protein